MGYVVSTDLTVRLDPMVLCSLQNLCLRVNRDATGFDCWVVSSSSCAVCCGFALTLMQANHRKIPQTNTRPDHHRSHQQ